MQTPILYEVYVRNIPQVRTLLQCWLYVIYTGDVDELY